MVHLNRVSKHYPGRAGPVLREVSLQVPRGQFLYLTGPSGAGKTTIMRLLLGAELPTRGRVRVGGKDLGRLGPRGLARFRRRVGFVFQDFKLVEGLSVFENVALSLRVAGVKGPRLVERVEQVLKQVGLERASGERIDNLSGGEQQRVAIARAMAADPPLILADEPTGNLDPQNAREVMRLLRSAHARGATVILATHDPALLGLVPGARVVRLAGGRLEEER